MTVMTHYLGERNFAFTINDLSQRSAAQTFFDRNGEQISVAEYYLKNYDIRLRDRDLPCAVQKKPKPGGGGYDESFYPLELLNIVSGQRISIQKQTSNLVYDSASWNMQLNPLPYSGRADDPQVPEHALGVPTPDRRAEEPRVHPQRQPVLQGVRRKFC